MNRCIWIYVQASAQYNARDYYHNIIIDRLFRRARRIAWAQVRNLPEAQELIKEQRKGHCTKTEKKKHSKHPQHTK